MRDGSDDRGYCKTRHEVQESALHALRLWHAHEACHRAEQRYPPVTLIRQPDEGD